LWGGKIGAAHTGLAASDIFLVHLPLYHVIALSYGVLSTLWVGGTVVLLPRFSASRFWPISVAEKCTWSAMVPFCVRALAEQDVPASHNYRAWGNAYWSADLEKRYNISILGWWGMTEIITHGIVGDVGRPGHPAAIGRPAPEYDVAIRRDDGSPIEVGETGHLFLRGRRGVSIFAGYLDDPNATADSFDESGFFKTGDLVTLHPDGFVQFADRAKDMLKVGGENVSASEIERVIQSVAGVRETAVVGRKHPMLQEVAVAYVVAASGGSDALREEIVKTCRTRLAEFKVPSGVHFLDELPRGLTEKVSKVELRRRANES
jgi:carnitine-CoA ligase